ncbi:hypothetical protein [Novosphingobium sp.]|uniref:hypothetical protein n=1 Tax=Novosphingobium sp. TaxID=1874826 RepID=UPI002FDDE900
MMALYVVSAAAVGFTLAASFRTGRLIEARRQNRSLRAEHYTSQIHVSNLQQALAKAYQEVDDKRAIVFELTQEIEARDARLAQPSADADARKAARRAAAQAKREEIAQARRMNTVAALDKIVLRPRNEVVAGTRRHAIT